MSKIIRFWWIVMIASNIQVGPHFATLDKCEAFRNKYLLGRSFGCYTEDGKDNAACDKAYLNYLREPPVTVCVSQARPRHYELPKEWTEMIDAAHARARPQ